MMELRLEGRRIQVITGGPGGHLNMVNGQLEAWDPDRQILLVNEMADNGVLSDKHLIVNWTNVLWFSFHGPATVEEVKQ